MNYKTYLLIIVLTCIYSSKTHLQFKNLSDGLFNKLLLLLILFLTSFENFSISLILMLIIFESFIDDGMNNEYFQSRFHNDRDP